MLQKDSILFRDRDIQSFGLALHHCNTGQWSSTVSGNVAFLGLTNGHTKLCCKVGHGKIDLLRRAWHPHITRSGGSHGQDWPKAVCAWRWLTIWWFTPNYRCDPLLLFTTVPIILLHNPWGVASDSQDKVTRLFWFVAFGLDYWVCLCTNMYFSSLPIQRRSLRWFWTASIWLQQLQNSCVSCSKLSNNVGDFGLQCVAAGSLSNFPCGGGSGFVYFSKSTTLFGEWNSFLIEACSCIVVILQGMELLSPHPIW